ncbi:MAG: leucine-rich repeat protein [Clostridia bacterium]|nr:leucine-rich repeat protein [Clostridia bacterium]
MKLKKRVLPGILVLTLITLISFSFNSFSLSAKTGTVGNLTWKIDGVGMLVISGTGEMIAPGGWTAHSSSINNVIVEEGVTTLASSAFNSCTNIRSISLPSTLTTINVAAFYNCYSLSSINLPDGLDAIGDLSFFSCRSLRNINIPNGVSYIGSYSFSHCTSLESIDIPIAVNYMGCNAFDKCDNLQTVNINSLCDWCDIDFYNGKANPLSCAKNLWVNGQCVSEAVIPEGTKKIKDYAFYNCDYIESIVIPDSITQIAPKAFTNSESVVIKCSVFSYPYVYAVNNSISTSYYEDIKSISIENPPEKTIYPVNGSFDSEGMVLKVELSDGSTKNIAQGFKIEDYDFSSAGSKSVTVSFGDAKTVFDVTVDPTVIDYPESDHLYPDNSDETWIYNHPHESEYLDITFSEDTFVDNYRDYIYVYDMNGNEVGKYTGKALADKTIRVDGDSFSIRLKTNAHGRYYGFRIVNISGNGKLNEPKLTVNNYDICISDAYWIQDIHYVSGIYTSVDEISNVEDSTQISNASVRKNTIDGNFVYEMPSGGQYTLWIKMVDGTDYIMTVDVTEFVPSVSSYGVNITIHDLYNVKDFFVAKGEYKTYREIKNNGYILSATGVKIGDRHDYVCVVKEPGIHTILIRYKDGTQTILYETIVVDEPVFSTNGLQVTIGNIPEVRVIRTAYGEYNTPGEIKRATGSRSFSANVIKDADSYMIQYRNEGVVTIAVVYNNGYEAIYKYNVKKKVPIVVQNGNTVIFTQLDDLNVIRYAKGEFTTSAQIKRAAGSVALKRDKIVDGKISVILSPGTYTFCVQYNDESYNYYIVTVE